MRGSIVDIHSATAQNRRGKKEEERNRTKLECGPMPNVMVALPNMAPSVQCRKVWLTPTTRVPCSNAAKTRKPLKLAGVPQTTGPISAASRPKFTILWDICRRYCCLTSFFPVVDTCLRCEDIARHSCAMVRRWRFFNVIFASCISDLHSKFAPRPHHV